MSSHVTAWVNAGQLLIGGAAGVLAAHQAWVWRTDGRRSPARAVAVAAAAMTAVLCLNAVLIARLPAAGSDVLLYLRSVALGALVLSIPPLGAAVSGRAGPRALVAALAGLVACRLILWPTTDLFSAHQLAHGLPRYGPLEAPVSFAIISLLLAYLFRVAVSQRRLRDRVVLVSGVWLTIVLGAVSFVVPSAGVDELLTGYLTLPCLLSTAALVVIREQQERRAGRRLEQQQRLVAELAEIAVHEPLGAVISQARRSLGQPLTERLLFGAANTADTGFAGPDDQWFVDTLRNVIGISAARSSSRQEVHDAAAAQDPTSELLATLARVATTQRAANATLRLRTVPADDELWCECVFIPLRIPTIGVSGHEPMDKWPAGIAAPSLSALTSREREIVQRLLDGDRVPAIARAMFLSPSTVRTHLSSVFNKLDVTSQQELIELLRPTSVGRP